MLELVAAFICLTSLLTYVNFRFIGLDAHLGEVSLQQLRTQARVDRKSVV